MLSVPLIVNLIFVPSVTLVVVNTNVILSPGFTVDEAATKLYVDTGGLLFASLIDNDFTILFLLSLPNINFNDIIAATPE